ncbi:MAG: FecR domain-containing protein [Desulfobacterales bacterium]|jgi:hypothetical protein|nr:FecR domain-containing protein [Desulfobacteraceae bacterium]MBT4364849.1 FecR domain-containing protein [Desulfobacteraceae bacterium]MBT7085200.1 FecR domain-containing protein [Desulfobacterales bacterium]MBT7696601.1 FecR domain-containing protein [Desulfobacterales bacterium]
MSRILNINLSSLIFLLLFISCANAHGQPVGELSFIIGDVFVSQGGNSWAEADFDIKIYNGDKVKTGVDSKCEITLYAGTIVRMDENSIQKFEKSKSDKSQKDSSLFLAIGKIWVKSRKLTAKDESFQVRTDKAVCSIRGTTFQVNAEKETTRVSVFTGKVATWSSLFDKTKKKIKVNVKVTRPVPVLGPKPVSVEKWVEIVKSFQEITFDSNGHFIKIDLDAKKVERDPWISWNMKRDKIME